MQPISSALITGITGQDGSYLAELLISKNYKVLGITRNAEIAYQKLSKFKTIKNAIDYGQLELINLESDGTNFFEKIISERNPEEIYNLACQSSVLESYSNTNSDSLAESLIPFKILNAMRNTGSEAKFLQASSSEIYAGTRMDLLVDEQTPLSPISPYGIGKAFSHQLVQSCRSRFDLFAVNAILFNHESLRRPSKYVFRKIAKSALECSLGLVDKVEFESLEVARDWGYAPDYVLAMWLAMQHSVAMDYVIATGRNSTLHEICKFAFSVLDMDYNDFVTYKPNPIRINPVNSITANPSRAKEVLGWVNTKNWENIMEEILRSDLNSAKKGELYFE